MHLQEQFTASKGVSPPAENTLSDIAVVTESVS